ncbi:MAG: hypothetical protein ACE15C_20260 [Phycisphaerae bacterium]
MTIGYQVAFAALVVIAGNWGMWGTPAQAQSAPATQPTVTVDQSIKHQTILGWGGTGGYLKVPDRLRDQLLDFLVDEIGLTRLRWEPPRHEWEYPFNDNDDPNKFNWDAYKADRADFAAKNWFVPFKQRVEARGGKFNLYVSPSFFQGGSSGLAPDWMMEKPEEYAEWVSAFLTYIKKTYQIEADYYCICNEAGNGNAFTPQVVARMIKAVGPRLAADGFKTKIEFPECVNPAQAWDYINKTKDDAEMWKYVGVVTYHLYGPLKQRPAIRDFAFAKGLPTGQTEFMGTTIHDLFDDLTEGGVSYWEHYGLAGPWGGNGTYLHTELVGTCFGCYVETWNFRQVMHYVRPGAVRVEAASNDAGVRSLAFVKDGKTTVVLLSGKWRKAKGNVLVKGLPPGNYGTSCSFTGNKPYRELGIREVGADGMLSVELAAGQTLTIYPYAGKDMPPIITDWEPVPRFVKAGTSDISLNALATDPECKKLTHKWEVKQQPEGGKARIMDAAAESTLVRDLIVPGEYLFGVTVSDGTSSVSKEVPVLVFDKNQPPEIIEIHNRMPVLVVLPKTSTQIRGVAMDLEGDKLTYNWSVVSQPKGADVKLEETKNKASGNRDVTGMTVAGDYVFKFEASDGQNIVSKELTVTVYPEGRFKWPGTK